LDSLSPSYSYFAEVFAQNSSVSPFVLQSVVFHALFRRQSRHHLLLGLSVKRQSKVSTRGHFNAVSLLQFPLRSLEGELKLREPAFGTAVGEKDIL
jgi:hypothetical protein